MSSTDRDKADVPIPPPLLFFMCLGVGLGLEYLLPLSVGVWWVPRIVCGGILLILSGYFALGSFVVLHKYQTPFDPGKPTVTIVQEGPFRLSRNPMYLSLLFFLGGVSVIIFSVWLFLSFFTLYFLMLFLAVRPEETYLLEKFGDVYAEYMRTVRRWL